MGRIDRVNIAGGRWGDLEIKYFTSFKLNVRHFESSKVDECMHLEPLRDVKAGDIKSIRKINTYTCNSNNFILLER